jgi:hypothetical protein
MGCVQRNSFCKSIICSFAWLFIFMITRKWFCMDVSFLCMLMIKPIDYFSAVMMCQVMWIFVCFLMNHIIFITHFLFLHPHNRLICSMMHLHLTKTFVTGRWQILLWMMNFAPTLFLVETVLSLLCDTISKTGVKLCQAFSVCSSR